MSKQELPTVSFCYSEAGAGCRKNPDIVSQLLTNVSEQQAVKDGAIIEGMIGEHHVLIEGTSCTKNCCAHCIASINIGTQSAVIEFSTIAECIQAVKQVLEYTDDEVERIQTRTDEEIEIKIRELKATAEAEFRELLRGAPKNPMT